MRCGADRGSSAHTGLRTKVGAALRALATGTIDFGCDGIPYRVHDATRARVLNWLAVEAGIHFRRLRPWGSPTHIQLEPTTRCNLRCALCPVTDGMRRETGSMDPDLYRRLLDEIGRTLLIMLLWDWGEPFVHPRIYDMIAIAKRRGVLVVSSSNGHPFARPSSRPGKCFGPT